MAQQPVGVKAVFDRALEIAAGAERAAFLDQACAGQPELRRKVEALLEAYAAAGSFLERPILDPVERDQVSAPGSLGADLTERAEGAGTHIGPDKVLEPGKLMRRHRGPLLAAALLLLALLAGIAGTTWGLVWAWRAEATRADAQTEAEEAKADRDRAVESERAAKADRDKAMEAEADTRAFADFLANYVLAATRPEGVQLGVGANVTMAEALAKAEPKLEEVFRGRPRAEALARHEIGVTWRNLGQFAQAEKHLRRAAELRERLLGSDHFETLNTLNSLAVTLEGAGRTGEAIALYEKVRDAQVKKPGADHPDTLTTLHDLAGAWWSVKKLDRSIPLFEEVLRLRKARLGPDHPDTLATMASLGLNYLNDGRQAKAIALLEETLMLARKRPGPLPDQFTWIPGVLAQSWDQAGQFARSEPLYRQFVEQVRQMHGPHHPQLAAALAQLGLNLLQQQKGAEAEPILRQSLAIRVSKEPDAWTTFHTQSLLGGALLGQKKYAAAAPLLLQGYQGMKERLAKMPPQSQVRLSEALERLVRLYDGWGKQAEAQQWREKLRQHQKQPRQSPGSSLGRDRSGIRADQLELPLGSRQLPRQEWVAGTERLRIHRQASGAA
jgi:tetratricopeptide (TPR) repeat protein